MTLTADEILQRKEKEKLRGRARRAEAKKAEEAAAAQKQVNTVETIEDFWAISRPGLDVGKWAEWLARQDYVEALLGDIRMVLEGREPDAEFIEDVDEQTREDVKQHGVAGITVPLLIGKFWQSPTLLEKLTSGDSPTAVFAKFGLLIAIDDYSLHKWNTFIAAHRRKSQPQPVKTQQWVTLTCSVCHERPTAVSSESAAQYARTGDYKCLSCLDKLTKVRNFTKYIRSHQIFDKWGRVRTDG